MNHALDFFLDWIFWSLEGNRKVKLPSSEDAKSISHSSIKKRKREEKKTDARAEQKHQKKVGQEGEL